jgi:hypothetical protein
MSRYSRYAPQSPLDPRSYYDGGRALTQAEVERSERLARITRVFTKIDRVLVGEKVSVTLATNGPAPAWSDGKTVTLNASEISDLDLSGMVNIHGLNYHEVCHLLYTPRVGSDLTMWVLDRNLMAAYNMLEDQRIETLFVGRNPAVAPYLSAVILRWLGDDSNKVASNYILVRGRRYLDVSVRAAFRRAFIAPDLIPAIESIVDEYRLLVFPRDVERAKVLIQRFQNEILDRLPQMPTSHCEGAGSTSAGRPVGGKEQEKDAASAASQQSQDERDQEPQQSEDKSDETDEQSGEGAGESDETDGEGGDEAGSGKGDGTDEGEDGESESGAGAGDEAGESGQGAGEGESSNNSGAQGQSAGKSKGSESEPQATDGLESGDNAGGAGEAGQSVEQAIREAMESVLNNEQVRSEMDSRSKSLRKGMTDGWFQSEIEKGSFPSTTPTATLLNSEKKFRQELRRLAEDCEPGWEYETPAGRLNVRRVMRGCDVKEAFDRWSEGNEGADLEVFIGVDASGSMNRGIGKNAYSWDSARGSQAADETLWILASALKGMGADVTATAFGSESYTVYSRDDKVGKAVLNVNHSGGTDALPVLEEAERLFRASTRKNRLLIMVTDGDWSSTAACDETMRRIEALGVLSAVAYIDTNGSGVENAFARYGHGAQVFGGVEQASDLTAWGKALVTATIKRFGAPTR